MKKLILLLSFCLIGLFSIGQTNRFPSIDSLKAYILKYYRNSTVETFTNLRGQNIAYGTAELLDSLTANMSGGVDSIWKSAGGGSDTLKYSKGGTTYTIGVLSNGAYVPYTGATADVDLGNFGLNAKGISVTGTAGNGHLHLKHQSSAPSSTGSSTTVYADANGNLAYKNDGLNRVTFNGLNITADRTFSFQNKSYTLADSADVAGKQGALTLTTTGSSGAATLVGNTLNIPQYSGGGGGSADSSWVSSETGITPNQLGYLVNSTLSALPSGWADVTPAASVTFSGKMIVSGGATTTASVTGNTGTQTAYANRIDMDYYPYSKMRYAFTVVPQDKTGTSNGFALHFKANAITTSFAMRIVFDLTNTADSGKISIGYDYSAAVATSANLSHNAGDTLDIEVVRDHWLIYAKIYNRRTAKQVDAKYYSYGSDFGTGGMAYLGLLGGEQHFLSAKVYSYDLKDGAAFTFLGDSQFAGSGATNEDKTFPFQIMRGNKNKIANLSAPGVTLSAIVNSHVPAAIALNNPVIVGAGFNDRTVLSTDTTTFKTRLDAVVDPLIAAGLPVWVTTLVPTNNSLSTFNTNFDLAIINYCAANGIPVIRIDSILKKNGDASNRIKENYLSRDAVHWSDSGQYIAGQKVLQIIGERMPTFFKDTVSPVKFYNVPTGEQNMSMLVLDEKTGDVKKVPAITFDIIYNARNYNGSGTIAQPAEIHITNPVKTDSAVFINTAQGILIGGNGGTSYSAGSSGSNFVVSTRGVGGTGFPQAFPVVTGLRNIIFEPLSSKSNSSITHSGNDNIMMGSGQSNVTGSDNLVLNHGPLLALTSGAQNIWLSKHSGRSITTGSFNFHAVTRNPSAANFSSSLTGTTIIGDFYNQTGLTLGNDEIWLSSGRSDFDQLFRFGGLGSANNFYFVASPTYSQTNRDGSNWYFRSSAGRGTGGGGNFIFQTYTAAASGTTVQTTPQTELTIDRNRIRVDNRFQTSTGADVASANDLTLGNDGNVFTITGTTQINAITTTNWQAGSEIILIFSGSVTVKNNTAGGANTAVMLLAGGVDFSATSNDVLKLVYNGTSWFEVSRSVN